MTRWRFPTDDERRTDTRVLEHFLEPTLAASIASLPVIDFDLAAPPPWSLRAEAWLWRTSKLLKPRCPE